MYTYSANITVRFPDGSKFLDRQITVDAESETDAIQKIQARYPEGYTLAIRAMARTVHPIPTAYLHVLSDDPESPN